MGLLTEPALSSRPSFPTHVNPSRLCASFKHLHSLFYHFAMSFGYSFGDFVAGANLSYRLIRALSETRGASLEYQEAINELASMQHTFLQVGQMRPSSTLSWATINAASYIVLSSVNLIAEFLEKTKKYREHFCGSGSGNAVSDGWRKMGWVLFKSDELKVLRDSLYVKMANIALLLSTAQL
jgi:hypothetical protein